MRAAATPNAAIGPEGTRHEQETLALVVVALTAAGAAMAEDNGWPKEIPNNRETLLIYQPQIDRFKGNILEGRAAMSFTAAGTNEPTFGVFWFKALLEADFDTRMGRLVSIQVPDDIYTIPPSNPHYNTTYVHAFDSTPEVVYTGYYPGYVNSYAYGGCVVYGTGWYYPPYVSPYFHHPFYPTWGYGVGWNPWYGWGVGVSTRPSTGGTDRPTSLERDYQSRSRGTTRTSTYRGSMGGSRGYGGGGRRR